MKSVSLGGQLSVRSPLLGAVLLVQLAGLVLGAMSVPFTSDSADYIEQARALAQAAATTRTTWGLDGPLVGPSTSFPPGYGC